MTAARVGSDVHTVNLKLSRDGDCPMVPPSSGWDALEVLSDILKSGYDSLSSQASRTPLATVSRSRISGLLNDRPSVLTVAAGTLTRDLRK